MSDPRRATPRTDVVLADPRLRAATTRLGGSLVKRAVADALGRCRAGEIDASMVADRAHSSLPATATSLRAVINATGVIVHTNLGRAQRGQVELVGHLATLPSGVARRPCDAPGGAGAVGTQGRRMAEADGNRTRLAELLGHVGFEDREGHQAPVRLHG